jgi:hypothetical protein
VTVPLSYLFTTCRLAQAELLTPGPPLADVKPPDMRRQQDGDREDGTVHGHNPTPSPISDRVVSPRLSFPWMIGPLQVGLDLVEREPGGLEIPPGVELRLFEIMG